MGIESPCLCRYDRQKHSGGVFLGRSAAVAGNVRCGNDRERQNAFWRNRKPIAYPTASTKEEKEPVFTGSFLLHPRFPAVLRFSRFFSIFC